MLQCLITPGIILLYLTLYFTGATTFATTPTPTPNNYGKRLFAEEAPAKPETDGFNLNVVSVTAGALAAPLLAMKCWNPWSVKIYVAGNAIYLGLEIINWGEYEKGSDQELQTYVKDVDDANKQAPAFRAAEKETRKAAKMLENKTRNAQILAATSGIAAAVALWEAWSPGPHSTCVASSETPETPAETGTTTDPQAPSDGASPNPGGDAAPNSPSPPAKPITLHNDLDGMFLLDERLRLAQDDQKSRSIDLYYQAQAQELFSQKTSQLAEQLNLAWNYLQPLLGKFKVLNSAHAQLSKMEMIGIGAGGVASVVIAKAFMEESKNSFIDKPLVRAIYFGGHAVVAYMASNDLGEASKLMKQRADAYARLAEQLENWGEGLALGSGIGTERSVNLVQRPQPPSLGTSQNLIPSEKIADVGYTSEMATLPTNTSGSGISTLNGIPPVLAGAGGAVKTASSALKAGDTKKGLLATNDLMRNASKVAAAKKKLEDGINAKLQAENKKPLNFRALEDGAANNLRAATLRTLSSLPEGARGSLASFAGGGSVPGGAASTMPSPLMDSVLAGQDGGILEGDGGAVGDGGKMDNPPNYDFLGADNKTDLNAELDGLEGEDKKNYDYQAYPQNDIIDNKDASLFEIVTIRYFKTAYPRLFEEKVEKLIEKELNKPNLQVTPMAPTP